MTLGSEYKFPGPGTAMAFAAAVAAGAAGYSHPEPAISKCLMVLAFVFSIFTLIIELLSGPYCTKKIEVKMEKLRLIKESQCMSKEGVITEEEFERMKEKLLSEF